MLPFASYVNEPVCTSQGSVVDPMASVIEPSRFELPGVV